MNKQYTDLKVGETIQIETKASYTDKDGSNGVHIKKTIAKIIKVGEWNAEYENIEILEESGVPSFSEAGFLGGGGFAPLGWDLGIKTGKYSFIG